LSNGQEDPLPEDGGMTEKGVEEDLVLLRDLPLENLVRDQGTDQGETIGEELEDLVLQGLSRQRETKRGVDRRVLEGAGLLAKIVMKREIEMTRKKRRKKKIEMKRRRRNLQNLADMKARKEKEVAHQNNPQSDLHQDRLLQSDLHRDLLNLAIDPLIEYF